MYPARELNRVAVGVDSRHRRQPRDRRRGQNRVDHPGRLLVLGRASGHGARRRVSERGRALGLGRVKDQLQTSVRRQQQGLANEFLIRVLRQSPDGFSVGPVVHHNSRDDTGMVSVKDRLDFVEVAVLAVLGAPDFRHDDGYFRPSELVQYLRDIAGARVAQIDPEHFDGVLIITTGEVFHCRALEI